MKNKIIGIIVIVVVLVGGALFLKARKAPADAGMKVIHPRLGSIQVLVSTTGSILPMNRLQVQPPVNGRIEQVLVKEGQLVKKGDTVAVMSSTDRAALLDAAGGQGEESLKYWQDVYKPILLSAPIDGQVIVGTVQPGQAVTTSDAVIVLSDRLIVRAQVDETDIGKVKAGQPAVVGMDAYPDVKINAKVEHIYYESKTVNNVTVYLVDLVPESIPDFIRSGMNANIDLIQASKTDILVLPLTAVQKENGESFVLTPPAEKPLKKAIVTGIADDKKIEIVSGLTEDDDVLIKSRKYALPKSGSAGASPFMPARPGSSSRAGASKGQAGPP